MPSGRWHSSRRPYYCGRRHDRRHLFALEARLTEPAADWLEAALRAAAADPATVHERFRLVAQHCGRSPLGTGAAAGWNVADGARVVLLAAVPQRPRLLPVLLALPVLEGLRSDLGDVKVTLVQEALRSDDTALLRPALGLIEARN